MPIRINLFHEEEKALRERQRDPVKLGLLATLLLILCQLVYWLILSGSAASKNAQLGGLRAEWEKLKGPTEEGEGKIEAMKTQMEAFELINRKVSSRAFWAPVLQQLLEGARRDVQLTEVNGAVSQEGNMRLAIHGITAGQEPRSVAEYLRETLEKALKTVHPETTTRFELLDENPDLIEINGRKFRNARFIIDCRMVNAAAKPPEPPPPPRHPQTR